MKKSWIFISSLAIIITVSSLGYYIFVNFKTDKESIKTFEKEELLAEIDGAVEKPGKYFFLKNETLRIILSKAIIKQEADLKNIFLNEKKDKNFAIYIPFKNDQQNKIQWKEIKDFNQLVNLGISKTISKKLINLKDKKENITWEDIEKIQGIGEKTLSKLKMLIELT